MKKDLHLILSEEKHRELRVLAAERGITMKDILLEGIELYKAMNSRTKKECVNGKSK